MTGVHNLPLNGNNFSCFWVVFFFSWRVFITHKIIFHLLHSKAPLRVALALLRGQASGERSKCLRWRGEAKRHRSSQLCNEKIHSVTNQSDTRLVLYTLRVQPWNTLSSPVPMDIFKDKSWSVLFEICKTEVFWERSADAQPAHLQSLLAILSRLSQLWMEIKLDLTTFGEVWKKTEVSKKIYCTLFTADTKKV